MVALALTPAPFLPPALLEEEVGEILAQGLPTVYIGLPPAPGLPLLPALSLEAAVWEGYLVLSDHPSRVVKVLAMGGRAFLYRPLAQAVFPRLPLLGSAEELRLLWEVPHGREGTELGRAV